MSDSLFTSLYETALREDARATRLLLDAMFMTVPTGVSLENLQSRVDAGTLATPWCDQPLDRKLTMARQLVSLHDMFLDTLDTLVAERAVCLRPQLRGWQFLELDSIQPCERQQLLLAWHRLELTS